MSLTNLLRDQFHVEPELPLVSFATTGTSVASRTVRMSGSGVVYPSRAFANCMSSADGQSPDNWVASGVLMAQPEVDDTPYRIKCRAKVLSELQYIIIGYAPSAPNGVNDLITKVCAIPFSGVEGFDDIILMRSVPKGDPEYGKAVAIGIAIESNQKQKSYFALSVQNLAVTAPQFAASMS